MRSASKEAPRRRVRPAVKHAALGAALVLACMQGGCSRQTEFMQSGPAPRAPLSDRVKVLQGDVVIVDGRTLRLANAFAPQPIPYARCWAEAVAAKEAARELRSLVADAHEIAVRPTEQHDEFNRVIAFVTLDRLDLGDTLVGMGLAARRADPPFRWCAGFSEPSPGAPTLQSLMDFSR